MDFAAFLMRFNGGVTIFEFYVYVSFVCYGCRRLISSRSLRLALRLSLRLASCFASCVASMLRFSFGLRVGIVVLVVVSRRI